jgi:hypothetical protein
MLLRCAAATILGGGGGPRAHMIMLVSRKGNVRVSAPGRIDTDT